MNKYTEKITNFLSSIITTDAVRYDCPLTTQIKNIYNTSNIDQLHKLIETNCNKLHDVDQDSLIYLIFKELHQDGLIHNINEQDLININEFSKWHNLNHNKINLHEILHKLKRKKKYKDFYLILFNPISQRKKLHQLLYENFFVSFDNIHHAESSNIIYQHYSNNFIDLHLYVPEHNEKYDMPNVKLIQKIFVFMSKLFNRPNERIELVVFYGEQKKLINFDTINQTLSASNVNSGVSSKRQSIMIWRKEEFYKVLIHELIHFFGIDFYVDDRLYKRLEEFLKPRYKIIGIDRINESYTEVLAIFLHSIVYSIEAKINFDEVINNEIKFSQFQVAKILYYFGCNTFENLNDTNIKQNTSIFSYYIVKTMFMMNYNIFFNFWLENNFKILGSNEQKYERLYRSIIIANVDCSLINFFIQYISQNKTNQFVFKTLRMSVYSF